MSSTATATPRRGTLLVALTILVAAGLVRFAAGLDGLWLDEIWSVGLATQVANPWQILTGLHHENNHYLNTFWIWLVGPESAWMVYRIPAMLAGALSVAFAGSIGLRRGRLSALLAMLLTAGSYLLIHYSSEARGYSYAVCCALACTDFEERRFRGAGWGAVLGVAANAIAGILSQPVFLSFYGALLLWSAGKTWFASKGKRRLRREWLLAHLPALLFFVWLYEVDLWQVFNAGGPIYPLGEVVAQTFSLGIGGPDSGTTEVLAGGTCALILYLASLYVLWRTDRDWCVLSVLSVVVMPAVLMLATGRREVYPRYFIIAVAFLQVTLALGGASVAARGRQGRLVAALLVGLVLAGNALHTWRLLSFGRGGYFPLMADLVEMNAGEEIIVGSDFDFRNQMVLSFYSQFLPPNRSLDYVRQDQWPEGGPPWLLLHFLDRTVEPEASITVGKGDRYRLERFYPYAGLSGWSWALYRNEGAEPVIEREN